MPKTYQPIILPFKIQKLHSYLGSFEVISDYFIVDKRCKKYFLLLH